MRSSESIAKVSAAVQAAQAELQNVVCDAANPHFRSKYASLPALLDTVRPVLAKHALALVQLPIGAEGRVGVETILLHASGEWIANELTVRPQKDDPQGAGSAITYCRRYSLAAALAIGQEDDDGNAASGRGERPRRRQDRPQPSPAPEQPSTPPPRGEAISEAQVKRFYAIARGASDAAGWPEREAVERIKKYLAENGIASSKEIPRDAYERICDGVKALFDDEAP